MTISFERVAIGVDSSGSATSVETTAFTPVTGEVLFAFFVPKEAQGSAPTISGGGLTWSLVVSRTDAPTRWVYRATVGSSPASMTVTASYGTASKAILHVVGYLGAGDVGATGQAFASGSSREVAFNLTTVEDDSVVVAFGSSDSPGDLSVAGEVVSPYTLRAANATSGGLTASNAAAQTKDRDTTTAGSYEVRMGTAAGGVTPFLANRHIFGIELAVGEDETFDPANLQVDIIGTTAHLTCDPSPTVGVDSYAWFRRTPQTGEDFDPFADEPIAVTNDPEYDDEGLAPAAYDWQAFGRIS